MSKSKDQESFLRDVGALLEFAVTYAERNELTVTMGDGYRSPVQAWINSMPSHTILLARTPDGAQHTWTDAVGGVGILKSKHTERLAIDLNFIKDNQLTQDIELLRPIGEFWEKLSPDNRWGGNFSKPDCPHFERNV